MAQSSGRSTNPTHDVVAKFVKNVFRGMNDRKEQKRLRAKLRYIIDRAPRHDNGRRARIETDIFDHVIAARSLGAI